MIRGYFSKLFAKDNRMSTVRGVMLVLCSVLYVICDDHTDKILTAFMTILAVECFYITE
jgi:hypothetical protein